MYVYMYFNTYINHNPGGTYYISNYAFRVRFCNVSRGDVMWARPLVPSHFGFQAFLKAIDV